MGCTQSKVRADANNTTVVAPTPAKTQVATPVAAQVEIKKEVEVAPAAPAVTEAETSQVEVKEEEVVVEQVEAAPLASSTVTVPPSPAPQALEAWSTAMPSLSLPQGAQEDEDHPMTGRQSVTIVEEEPSSPSKAAPSQVAVVEQSPSKLTKGQKRAAQSKAELKAIITPAVAPVSSVRNPTNAPSKKAVTLIAPKASTAAPKSKTASAVAAASKKKPLSRGVMRALSTKNTGGVAQVDVFLQQCVAFERLLTNAATFQNQMDSR